MALAFSRILVAYDDSAGSRIALEYACALARGGARLTVAHAVNEYSIVASAMSPSGGFAAIDPTPLITAVDGQGAAVLETAVAACATFGVTAEPLFIHEAASAGISAFVASQGVDLIVLGTHGRRGVSRAVLGSVAEGILRHSDVPVLVVTSHAKAPRTDLFARVLVALDDSDPARAALSIAARLAQALGTHLTLCNVIDSRDLQAKAGSYGYDPRPIEAEMHATSLQLLQRAKAMCSDAVSNDDLVILEGEAAETIEHAAMQHNCDAIVLGSHGRKGLERVFLGSVAEAVARSSALPVFVIPAAKLPH